MSEPAAVDDAPGRPYTVTWRDRIAEIRLACGKANALNPRSLGAIAEALDEAARGEARGAILTGYDHFFSAGLDLVTLYDLSRLQLDAFMRDFDRVMLELFAFPRPVVAAVNGHAVAGGCILALACDARVLASGEGRMGLNEIQLGVPFPASALEIARHAVPGEFLESILYGGGLYDPQEAVARGLADGVATGDVLAQARGLCRSLCEPPSRAFATIKAALKAPALQRAHEALDRLRQAFVEAWFAPDARQRIGETRARLLT